MWTLDIDPAAAVHGVPGRHIIGDIREHHTKYEHVACYGILGFCPIPEEEFEAYDEHLAKIVKPGGTLMLGHHVGGKYDMEYWDNRLRSKTGFKVLKKKPSGIHTNYIWWGLKT